MTWYSAILTVHHYDLIPFYPGLVNAGGRAGAKVIRLHDARHTHASLMLKQGVYPKIVQERLGHATIAVILDTYSHVAPGLQQAAAKGFDKMVLPKREKEAVVNHY